MNRKSHITTSASAALRVCRCCVVAMVMAFAAIIISCEREPHLYLHDDGGNVDFEFPDLEFELDIFWDYELDYGVSYNWREEWYYGEDPDLFDHIGYTKPNRFDLRRYHTGEVAYAPHTNVQRHFVVGNRFREKFDWGYWDLLIWNEIQPDEHGIQSLYNTEELDSVIFYVDDQTAFSARYQAPRYTRSFFQPEELFAGYKRGVYIDRELTDFTYDPERNVYVRNDSIDLYPATYIYLTQVILHNNRGRVSQVDGNANLSGMAKTVNINTGITGQTPITIYYNVGMKKGVEIKRKNKTAMENVDIIGGRVLTLGLCGIDGSRLQVPKRGRAIYPDGTILAVTPTGHNLYIKDNEVHIDDRTHHYMDVTMHFSNGNDSTFVFDVTDQVRRRWKGGVLTVELDMDTVEIPSRSGGSGFDAVVEDFEIEDIPEFEM